MNWKVDKDKVIIALLIAAIFIIGCSKSIVIDQNERIMTRSDTSFNVVRDTTETTDTTRDPITFSVSVEGWEEIIINP